MRGDLGCLCARLNHASNGSTAHTTCSCGAYTDTTPRAGATGSTTHRRESGALLPRTEARLPTRMRRALIAWQEAPEAMTPEAMEASSIALAWKLQQEEQAAFYQAISANTPVSLGARAAAATPEQPAQMTPLASASSEDASLQLALRLQQVPSLGTTPC